MKNIIKFFCFFIAYIKDKPLQSFGFIYALLAITLSIVGPAIVPHTPIKPIQGARLLAPSKEYWFGTDANGMCIFSRTICAYRTDLLIALWGALMAFGVGTLVGIFAGYFEGKGGIYGALSTLIMRIMDVIQAFPIFVLALVLVAAFGPNALNIIFCIFITNLPTFLRLSRAETLFIREKPFVEAAKASGNSDLRITFVHIMPNTLTQCVAMVSMVMGFGILLTAGLSFVGAGIRAPTPEWGLMISTGAPAIVTGHWWPSFFPGLFMAISIFSFSMIGETITALFDPLERKKLGY